jgi:dihydrofolate reductase
MVAMARNGVIGQGNQLPWHLPEDLKRFKALTLGKPVLMGRRTFESIGRPLPLRTNLVLTRNPEFCPPGVQSVPSLDEALSLAEGAAELVVIGGAQVYRAALPVARRIYLTRVEADVPGDTCFPALDLGAWRQLEHATRPADARHAYALTFETLERD